MQRHVIVPRGNWEEKAKEIGFLHHTVDDVPYWAEDRYYSFTMDEVLRIEAATNELHARCLEAVQHVIDQRLYAELAIPERAIPLIERSWNEDAPSIYGRFDFAFSGGEPKMLEYNADTPTSLIEASVAQWDWLQDKFPKSDQFNSIHEKLLSTWAYLRPYMKGQRLHFASVNTPEDICTVNYIRDVAKQAGHNTLFVAMEDIGWHPVSGRFVDDDGLGIDDIFMLYPWEWMLNDGFEENIVATNGLIHWIEPAWKMILSNKGILPILWDLFQDHPNLLPAYREEYLITGDYVSKPLLSREGHNIKIHSAFAEEAETGGDYGEEGFIYQEYAPLPVYDGFQPVVGSWVIGGEAAGMGIREANGPITGNLSRFVPHLIED